MSQFFGGFGRRHQGCGCSGGGLGFSLGRRQGGSASSGCGGSACESCGCDSCAGSGCGQSHQGLRQRLARLGGRRGRASSCDCVAGDGYFPSASYGSGEYFGGNAGCAANGAASTDEGPAPHLADPKDGGGPAEMPTPEVIDGSMNMDTPMYEDGTWGAPAAEPAAPAAPAAAPATPAQSDGALNPANVDLYNPSDADALPAEGNKDA